MILLQVGSEVSAREEAQRVGITLTFGYAVGIMVNAAIGDH